LLNQLILYMLFVEKHLYKLSRQRIQYLTIGFLYAFPPLVTAAVAAPHQHTVL